MAESSLKHVVRNLFKIGTEFESSPRGGKGIPELRRARDALLARVAEMAPRLPRSPLDVIIDARVPSFLPPTPPSTLTLSPRT